MRLTKWVTIIAAIAFVQDGLWATVARASETPLPEGVISYWTFDDGTAVDEVGGNDGTVYGAVSVPGKVRQSMFFDGYSTIHMPYAPVFGSGDFTVAFWGKDAEPLSGVEGIFSTTEGSPWTQVVLYGGDWAGIDTLYTHLPSESVCAADTFSRTAWSFIVLRRTGNVFEWIINGALNATCYDWLSGGSWDSTHPELGMNIGSSRPAHLEEPLTGYVDELAFFNRAVTDEEIQDFYQNGLAGRGYGWTGLRDIKALVATIAAMNLENGMQNSLDRKLAAAQAVLVDLRQRNNVAARNQLNALLDEVQAQRGKNLSYEEADLITEMAQKVIDSL